MTIVARRVYVALSLSLCAVSLLLGADKVKKSAPAWETARTVKQIPSEVLKALQSKFGSENRLADVGEEFDATDVITGLPQRRLVLAGHRATEWFIAYEHGGRGLHLDVVILDVRATPPKPVLAVSPVLGVHDDETGWRLTLEDLKPVLDGARPSLFDAQLAHY